MKNGRFFQILTLLMAAVICLAACSRRGEPEQTKETAPEKNQVEEILFERLWKHDEETDQDVEYAMILGVDANEEPLWSHVTRKYPVAMMDTVEEVLRTETQYVFCEYGTLVSLDISTGEVLWENEEFKGFGVWGIEAENGNLYFCGYLGTSFFVTDETGKTLHRIDSFGPEYDWAHDIRFEGDKIAVPLGLGPQELQGPDGFVAYVNPRDYSFEVQSAGVL